MEENKLSANVITFARSVTPMPVEVKQGSTENNYIRWGENNLYPNFLLQLFNEVALHSDIVKSKVNYLMGDGIVIKTSGKKAEYDINTVDSFEEVVRKLILDFLIFNFYVLEVQYNVLGQPINLTHLPAHHLRSNKAKTKFWVCDDWQAKKEVLTYDRWIKGKNDDGKSKIFMYSGYLPSVNNVYPVAAYSPAIENMQAEILIKQFNKNNIEDGFSPSHIISFFFGQPTTEQAREFEKKFGSTYSGANGKKFIINYNQAGAEKGVEVDTISNVDFTGALDTVHNMNVEGMLNVHQATSRSLFGLNIEGSLGDKNTLETAYQIFKNVFVKDNRNVIESGLNKILVDFGLEEIEFKDKANLFAEEVDSTTREKILTIDELRAIDGKQPLPNGAGAYLIGSVPAPTYSSTSTGSTENVFEDTTYKNGRILKDDDFELVKDMGLPKINYTILSSAAFSNEQKRQIEIQFDDDNDVDNYLMENTINDKTLSEIKADIRRNTNIVVTTDELEERISALTDANIIRSEVVDGRVKITPVRGKNPRTVETMYEYKVKDGYGQPLISTSRGFCVKLIENDRLYTRADIQQMSSIFGYDVFKHSGGWYFNPDKQQAENQCRHFWNQVRVVRKDSRN